MQSVHGIAPVILTPFTPDGEVDMTAFAGLARYLVACGSHGITLFGIVTEFHKLSDAERQAMAACLLGILKEQSGPEPVYSLLSVTEHSTELAVRAARRYRDMGADSLMLLPPHFMNPPVEAVQEHMEAVLAAVDIPVLIQYAPKETGRAIPVETMARIANSYPHARFKIEPNPPMDYIRQLLALAPHSQIMIGYAGLYMLDVLAAGGKGTIPGCSFTEIYLDIHASWLAGDQDRARGLHARLLPYIRRWMSDSEYLISAEKRILQLRGLIPHGGCRRPAYPLTDEDDRFIRQFLREFADWLH